MQVSLEEIRAEAAEEDRDKRLERDLRKAIQNRDKQIEDLSRKLELITSIDQAKLRVPKWLAPPKRATKAHHGTVCMMLTDTHFGEVVNPAEIDFINAYDDEIAALRLRRFTEKGIEISKDYISGIQYDGMTLFWGGDIFTGTIHDELLETNSETLYASVVRWIEPLAAMCYRFADEFGKLHNAVTYGNHGRRTKKPRSKLRAQDNIEWLLYKVLERETRHDKRISWQIPDGADTLLSVYETRFLLTHGDQFRGGSGIAGAMSPMLLGSHRKTRRAMASGRPYDIMIMGHYHQLLTLPGIIVGGTLKGTDEYAYLGNFGYEPAQQALWITTPEHGITMSAPILVVDREAEKW
jgi:hypothetical protein